MGGFFNVEGDFHRWASLIADIVLISLLWIVFSVPLLTLGPSTTAAYYVCTKKVSGRDGYVIQGFFKSFKENFFKSTFALIILVVLGTVLIFNMMLLDGDTVQFAPFILIAQYFIFLQLIFVAMYVFALIARFEMKLGRLIRIAFLLSNRHILFTMINLVLLAVLFMAAVEFPLLFMFVGGIYIYLSSYLLVRVFRKHYPDFDPQLDGDIKPLSFEEEQEQEETDEE